MECGSGGEEGGGIDSSLYWIDLELLSSSMEERECVCVIGAFDIVQIRVLGGEERVIEFVLK